ncbi:MAG: CbtA family protein [Nocardioidaceae bacterium]|nr:MAG: CbtA family protein [Nocardioidaceae bacterium]
MREVTWGRRLGNGALAGLAGGVASAVILWLLVEPQIRRAIAIEDAGAAATDAHDHGGAAAAHDHGGEVVTRFQQQIGGTVTIIIVAVLLGLVFAVVYARAAHRLPGNTAIGRSLTLATLAFLVMGLMPALVIPSNPPAVGDPDTVNQRTLTYILVILLSVLAVGLTFAVEKLALRKGLATEWRWLVTAASAVVLATIVLVVTPHLAQPIPAEVPTDLIWKFRVGSLAQLAAMWAAIGLGHGILTYRFMRHPVVAAQTAFA